MIWGTDDFRSKPVQQGVCGSEAWCWPMTSSRSLPRPSSCARCSICSSQDTLGTADARQFGEHRWQPIIWHPVKRVVSIVWAISAAVGPARGVLLAPIHVIHANVGLVLGLKRFRRRCSAASARSRRGVGGVLIGVIESMAGFYLPQGWKDVAPNIVLLVVLLLKPEGLFGLHMRKEGLEHDPEKWEPVSEKDHAQTKKMR